MALTGLWPEDNATPLGVAYQDAEAAVLAAGGTEPHSEYERDAIGWIVDKLGIPEHTLRWSLNPGYEAHSWDGTPDPLIRIARALEEWEDVGVESGTGTGKSFFVACLILWFLAAFRGARVWTFAPKEDQLKLYIWAEIGKLWPRFQAHFPAAKLTSLQIQMEGTDQWGAWGYAVGVKAGEESSTKAQGMHAEHMLLVYEETPGIPPPVIVAGENTCTGPHNLRIGIGNPDHQHDALHQMCLSPGVVHVRMSSLDHPNVVADDPHLIPGAVSRKAVERRRVKYGEDSRMYQTRIRGISPSEAASALIRLSWVEAAVARYNDPALRKGHRAKGVDVANSESGDQGAIADFLGACCLEVRAFPCPDANELARNVYAEMLLEGVRPEHVGVDSVGVGAGTVNEFKRLGVWIQALNSGTKAVPTLDEDADLEADELAAVNAERFGNLRSQMWWQARMDLQYGLIALPADEELAADLITPTWETKNGVIWIESKEKIKDRLPGGRSPNKGDAFVYGNWVRHRTHAREKEQQPDPWDRDLIRAQEEWQKYDRPAPRLGGRVGGSSYHGA